MKMTPLRWHQQQRNGDTAQQMLGYASRHPLVTSPSSVRCHDHQIIASSRLSSSFTMLYLLEQRLSYLLTSQNGTAHCQLALRYLAFLQLIDPGTQVGLDFSLE